MIFGESIRLTINLVIIVFGLFGNTTAFLIYTNKVFRKQAIGVYFACLAVFDSSSLIVLLIETKLINTEITQIYCKLVYYAEHSIKFITAWILVATALDLLVFIIAPFKFSIIRKFKFQLWLIAGITVISLLKNIDVLFVYKASADENVTNVTECIKEASMLLSHELGDLVLSVAMPSGILLVSSIVIIIKACIMKKSKNNTVYGYNNKRIRRHKKYLHLAVTVICMNLNFLFSNLPLAIYQLFREEYLNDENSLLFWVFYVVDSLDFIHNSTPIIVYLASNRNFRTCFLNLFLKICKQERPVNDSFTKN